MRSGQYKLNGGGGSRGGDEVTLGHFKSSSSDLLSDFPHLNSLVVTANRINNTSTGSFNSKSKKHISEKTTDVRKIVKEIEEAESNDQIDQKNAIESSTGARQAFNRVEQKVRSLLQQGEAKIRAEVTSSNQSPVSSPVSSDGGWQYGHVVTVPRRPKNSIALSQSALDTASCLSASSGYSSTSSSSYGSFKSSGSMCSTLPRHHEHNSYQSSKVPLSQSRALILVDNPLYDVTPAYSRSSIINPIYDTPQLSALTRSSYRTLSTSEGSKLALLDENQALHDPVARRCRDYFERRLANSESLCKRWSVCSNDSGADSGETETPPTSLSNSDPPSIDSSTSSNESTASINSGSVKKTPLDRKMEFLRKEIVSTLFYLFVVFKFLHYLHGNVP